VVSGGLACIAGALLLARALPGFRRQRALGPGEGGPEAGSPDAGRPGQSETGVPGEVGVLDEVGLADSAGDAQLETAVTTASADGLDQRHTTTTLANSINSGVSHLYRIKIRYNFL